MSRHLIVPLVFVLCISGCGRQRVRLEVAGEEALLRIVASSLEAASAPETSEVDILFEERQAGGNIAALLGILCREVSHRLPVDAATSDYLAQLDCIARRYEVLLRKRARGLKPDDDGAQ